MRLMISMKNYLKSPQSDITLQYQIWQKHFMFIKRQLGPIRTALNNGDRMKKAALCHAAAVHRHYKYDSQLVSINIELINEQTPMWYSKEDDKCDELCAA